MRRSSKPSVILSLAVVIALGAGIRERMLLNDTIEEVSSVGSENSIGREIAGLSTTQ